MDPDKDSGLRLAALQETLKSLMRQDNIDRCEILVVEARLKNTKSNLKDIIDKYNKFNNVKLITIESTETKYKYYSFIYQKEILINYVYNNYANKDLDILIFLDADIVIKDPDWITSVFNKFDKCKEPLLLYPWNNIVYLNLLFKNLYSNGNPADIYGEAAETIFDNGFNPGLCISIKAKDFIMMPEYFYLGGGDTAFLYMHGQEDSSIPSNFGIKHYQPAFQQIDTLRKKYKVDKISDIDIYHVWHGHLVDYAKKFSVMAQFKSSVTDILIKEPSGLLRWKNIDCKEFQMIESK